MLIQGKRPRNLQVFSTQPPVYMFVYHHSPSSVPSSPRRYQIGRVVPNSPAHKAGLVPFFDFIQDVDGNPIEQRQSTFFRVLRLVGNNKDSKGSEEPSAPRNLAQIRLSRGS